MSLIGSLRALPPKQALTLALAEKARRVKKQKDQEQLLRAAESSSATLPAIREVPSLVLNKAHPLSDLYYKKARYKVYWGGRGSAKSWGFAEALVRIAAERPVRILCAREFQNSIKESVHEILKQTIYRLGLEKWFDITDSSIRSRIGSQFFFKGLHNNEHGIRSTEGIDIVWVEEAHTVSAASWRSLAPTVRRSGSEIWISFNFVTEDDATFKRFVDCVEQEAWTPGSKVTALQNTPRSRSIVWKLNYDSNPYFGGELAEEMEDDRKADPNIYEHIWLGMPLKISNSVIYSGKYVQETFHDDIWKSAQFGLKFGLDWGYAQDPLACLRMFMVDVPKGWPKIPLSVEDMEEVKVALAASPGDAPLETILYISHELYGTGIELDELPNALRSALPDVESYAIKADCAQPAMISDLARNGFACSGAEKWQGCVEDGITTIRKFRAIVVHPRCVKTMREFRLYSWKVDKKQLDEKGRPMVLPIIVDKNNHAMDGMRYGLDGYIQRGGILGMWSRLGNQQ